MSPEPEFSRGIHTWVIEAEGWSIDEWRRNIRCVPQFLVEAALKISQYTMEEREDLLQRACSLPANSVDDYVRYEIMADLCTLTEKTLSKLQVAIQLNQEGGQSLEGEGIDWRRFYYYD